MKMTDRMIFNIDGMHCSNCEKRVKDTLARINGIKKAEVSIKNKKAIIELENGCLDRNKIMNEVITAVDELGYNVILR